MLSSLFTYLIYLRNAILAFAVSLDRAVLTGNRRDYIKLHRSQPNHSGIIVCTEDLNFERLASRIDEAISDVETLREKLIRVNRPLKWERAISTLLELVQLNDEYS